MGWQMALCWAGAVIACVVCGFCGAVYVLNKIMDSWH